MRLYKWNSLWGIQKSVIKGDSLHEKKGWKLKFIVKSLKISGCEKTGLLPGDIPDGDFPFEIPLLIVIEEGWPPIEGGIDL